MKNTSLIRSSWQQAVAALAVVVGTYAGFALAQEDDPFGAGDGKGGSEKKEKEKEASPKPGKLKEVVDETPDFKVEHPVVIALRERPPKTLDGLTRALKLALDLSRPDVFREFVAPWLELKASDTDALALQRKYGSALFIEMGRRPDFQPEGRQVGYLVLSGASKVVRDPARLDAAIKQLSDGDQVVRVKALREISAAGPAGVVALFHALAADAAEPSRAAIRSALVALGRESIEPAIAAIGSSQIAVRADAANVLGRLKVDDAIPLLVGIAVGPAGEDRDESIAALKRFSKDLPTKPEVETFLARRIRNYLAGDPPGDIDDQETVRVSSWDEKTHSPVVARHPRALASLIAANRLALSLEKIAIDPANQRLALVTRLEFEQTQAGLDTPLAALPFPNRSLDEIQAVLLLALKLDRTAAATAACDILGASGRSELLAGVGGKDSPLVIALASPNRRVQFSAVMAILKLDSPQAFPGASRVVEMMRFFLSTRGRREVLIAHGRSDEAQRIARMFAEIGFDSKIAISGSELVRMAKESPDFEMILVSDTINRPSIMEVVQVLRQDPRSAGVPIGVMEQDPQPDSQPRGTLVKQPEAARKQFETVEDAPHYNRHALLASLVTSLATKIYPPQSNDGLYYQAMQVLHVAGDSIVPADIRLEQAEHILDQVATLAARKNRPSYYDLLRMEKAITLALREPALAPKAAEILGNFGTPSAQLALVEQANLPSRSFEERSQAVAGFGEAVKLHGLQLTQRQIQRQYDSYNASAAAGAETQKILGDILDIVEAPRAARRAQEDNSK